MWKQAVNSVALLSLSREVNLSSAGQSGGCGKKNLGDTLDPLKTVEKAPPSPDFTAVVILFTVALESLVTSITIYTHWAHLEYGYNYTTNHNLMLLLYICSTTNMNHLWYSEGSPCVSGGTVL